MRDHRRAPRAAISRLLVLLLAFTLLTPPALASQSTADRVAGSPDYVPTMANVPRPPKTAEPALEVAAETAVEPVFLPHGPARATPGVDAEAD